MKKGGNLSSVNLRDFSYLIANLRKVFLSRVLASGFAYVKAVRGDLMNYLSGNPLRSKKVRLSTQGIPICLGPSIINKILKEDFIYIRFTLTILFSTRALKSEPDPDLYSITSPSKRSVDIIPFYKFGIEF